MSIANDVEDERGRAMLKVASGGEGAEARYAPESNAVVATAVIGAAVVMDALTAHDGALDERPSALRGTAVVLVLCTAAPPLREWLVQSQRLLTAALLALVAFLGRHIAAETVRVGDALYVSIVTLIVGGMYRLLPLDMTAGCSRASLRRTRSAT